MKPANEGSVPMQEMLDICDTEGNSQNGGGSFVIENHEPNGIFVKFEPGRNTSMSMSGGLGPGRFRWGKRVLTGKYHGPIWLLIDQLPCFLQAACVRNLSGKLSACIHCAACMF